MTCRQDGKLTSANEPHAAAYTDFGIYCIHHIKTACRCRWLHSKRRKLRMHNKGDLMDMEQNLQEPQRSTKKEKILTGVSLVLAGALAGALLMGGGGIRINIGSFNGSRNVENTGDCESGREE
jgi:NAD-dependent DNA ligase